jgi:hypothetical protein
MKSSMKRLIDDAVLKSSTELAITPTRTRSARNDVFLSRGDPREHPQSRRTLLDGAASGASATRTRSARNDVFLSRGDQRASAMGQSSARGRRFLRLPPRQA